MNVVALWTGERADTLRQALRMTNEAFAEHLGIAVARSPTGEHGPVSSPGPSCNKCSMSR